MLRNKYTNSNNVPKYINTVTTCQCGVTTATNEGNMNSQANTNSKCHCLNKAFTSHVWDVARLNRTATMEPHTPLYLIIFVTVQQWQVASCMKAHLGRVREQHTADCRRTCPVSFPSQTRCWNQSRRSWCSCHCPAADSLPVTVSRALSISCIFPHVKYKKLRYYEEHSASAVLSWCTWWHFSGENLRLPINHFYVAKQATQFREITWNNGHYIAQGISRSPIWVPIESPYATSYKWLIVT